MKRIQPQVSDETYTMISLIKTHEKKTTASIVEKAIFEYTENHYPQIINAINSIK